MKKLALLLFLSSISITLFAQKTIKITEGDKKNYAEFYVLESDKSIKHGSYTEYVNKNLLVKGQYEKGNKIATWTFYKYGKIDKTIKYGPDVYKVHEYYGDFEREIDYRDETLTVKNGAYIETLKGKPYTTGQFINNKEDGHWKYYADDKVFFETTFKYGQPVTEFLYSHDTLISTINFENGLREGKIVTNYGNGKPEIIANYNQGKLHGAYSTYNRKGIEITKSNFNEGKYDGMSETRYANGKLKNVLNYKNDSLNGIQKVYYSNGQLMLEVKFEMGKPMQVLKALTSTGVLNEDVELEDGNGNIIVYFDDDKPLYELNIKNGELEGKQRRFFNNGDIDFEEEFTAGTANGNVVDYDNNGTIIKKGEVKNGYKLGLWTEYDYDKKANIEKTYQIKDSAKYYDNVSYKNTISLYYPSSVFTVVEDMPQYPGGMPALADFLRRNVVYPEMERNNDIQGVSYVQFVVNKRGFIEDVRIYPGTENKATPNMHAEGIRVIELMPRWKPGFQRGQPVKVSYSIPIRYKLR